ncbi:2-oxo-4-hydroxy-4-carboxy-5-ureidoimidazoline decarboxylase [Nocardioides plantarum]|uniref:2-oxo-4-hydroxy-4-carboxy-5-ureidoimidazoline decarboxylase n=1 Tax=Nocardioides plantarum TaxID=29299 RepID=UPI001120A803|nr:2-oxo-4-hydroxy-4-carboxy-5-ureidoimidazoline decarboxylase [Nocardioides plantarum]
MSTLTDFNAESHDDAVARLAPCVAIGRWAEDLATGRPYDDVAAVVAASQAHAATWTPSEVETALAGHPRIGERPTAPGAQAVMSSREQAGVDRSDADVLERLRDGNARYEERFDRIYLVRAAGRSAEEMLDLLEERLTHDPATEIEVTRGQLAEITALRVQDLLS